MSNSDEPENDVRAPRPRRASAPESASSDQLEQTGKNGANWFYWIAGLSLVNTAMAHGGADRHFIIGLSITAIVDAIAQEIGKTNPDSATLAMGIAIEAALNR